MCYVLHYVSIWKKMTYLPVHIFSWLTFYMHVERLKFVCWWRKYCWCIRYVLKHSHDCTVGCQERSLFTFILFYSFMILSYYSYCVSFVCSVLREVWRTLVKCSTMPRKQSYTLQLLYIMLIKRNCSHIVVLLWREYSQWVWLTWVYFEY